jgi:hypothetical protein
MVCLPIVDSLPGRVEDPHQRIDDKFLPITTAAGERGAAADEELRPQNKPKKEEEEEEGESDWR